MQQSVKKNDLSRGQRFWRALVKLDFISKFFTWTMELLARVTEPLASLSAIYIIVVAGVPALMNNGIYVLALALIIGSPELLIVGAFKIASRELSHGNKKAWWLMISCFALLLLTALTVGDLFVWHWQQNAVNVLMGCRCLAGIAYTFTRGVVTDDSELDVSQGSQVHSLLAEFTAGVQDTVNQAGQFTLAEVNRVNQATLAEVHRMFADISRQQQQLINLVNGVNHQVQGDPQTAIEVMGQQSQSALDLAVERLERTYARRIEAVHTRLAQVRITMESNPALPAVNTPGTPLRLPSRVHTQQSKQVHSEPAAAEQVHRLPVNLEEVNSQSEPEGSLDGSKVNAGKQFAVNHFQVHSALPTLAMIQTAVVCSKTLASRARGQAVAELGLVGSGE